MKITKYLEMIDLTKSEIRKNLGLAQSNSLIAFRGESKDFGTSSLKPSFFRENFSLSDEKRMFEFLKDFNIVQANTNDMVIQSIESQHYIALSRMLDITFNALIGLYFACSEMEDEDGACYVFCFPDSYSPNSDYVSQFYKNVVSDNNYGNLVRTVKVISASLSNARVVKQSGGFILFPNSSHLTVPSVFYTKIEILAQDKKIILKELREYFDIDVHNIYPEKDKLRELIKSKIRINRGIPEPTKLTFESVFNYEVSIYMQQIDFEINGVLSSYKKTVFNNEFENSKIIAKRKLRKIILDINDIVSKIDELRITGVDNFSGYQQLKRFLSHTVNEYEMFIDMGVKSYD